LLTAALVLGALLAVAAVLFVARPLLREPRGDDALEALAPEERRRLELAEERDRALAALKELEFDHRTGKVSDEDYRTLLRELRRNAADALRALDAGTPGTDVRDRS
jgi:cytochrome c-type biogenesis protein CcmI